LPAPLVTDKTQAIPLSKEPQMLDLERNVPQAPAKKQASPRKAPSKVYPQGS
jgi:hypothetical protein